jgi:hypothetical protein
VANLIYERTLKAMSISLESLKPIDCSFHGIVPGSANYPLRKVELDVSFGDSGNYRREKLEFEVMDWPSQYHAILGQPAFAKFMAVPHYAPHTQNSRTQGDHHSTRQLRSIQHL